MTTYRNACFTSFILELDYDLEKIEYIVCGKETCPTTGRLHTQGFIQLKTKAKLKALQKIIGDPACHVENMKGTPEQASNYCKKEGDFTEEGALRQQGQRNDLKTIKNHVINQGTVDITLIENQQQLRFAEGLLKYTVMERNWKPYVEWIYGPPGIGKTKMATEICPYNWMSNKTLRWWEGYNGQENVIIDEFRADFCKFHELLRILDRYPYRVEFKGGSRPLLAKKIIITSCFSPYVVYNEREDIQQLIRRITTITEIRAEVGDEVHQAQNSWGDEVGVILAFPTSIESINNM